MFNWELGHSGMSADLDTDGYILLFGGIHQ